MLLLIKYTLLYGIVLMLVALGGMFSEHSGIINIALEGIMVIGGVAGVLTLTMLPASLSPFLVVLISILVAALAGVIYSLLLAFASINLKADQTIGGTALNLLATAIAVVISKYFSESGSAKLNYSNKPFLFSIGGLELSVFVPLGLILLVVSYIVLYKTRFGLRLRACGGTRQAASPGVCVPAASIRRLRTRWASTFTRCVTPVSSFPVRWAPSAVWPILCPRCRPGTLKSAWPVQAFWHWQL